MAFAESFVGLSISDSKNEGMHNRLKDWIPRQEYYTTMVQKTLKFIDHQNSFAAKNVELERYEYENVLSAPYLREVRFNVPQKIFLLVFKQLLQAIKLSHKEESSRTSRIQYDRLFSFTETVGNS